MSFKGFISKIRLIFLRQTTLWQLHCDKLTFYSLFLFIWLPLKQLGKIVFFGVLAVSRVTVWASRIIFSGLSAVYNFFVYIVKLFISFLSTVISTLGRLVIATADTIRNFFVAVGTTTFQATVVTTKHIHKGAVYTGRKVNQAAVVTHRSLVNLISFSIKKIINLIHVSLISFLKLIIKILDLALLSFRAVINSFVRVGLFCFKAFIRFANFCASLFIKFLQLLWQFSKLTINLIGYGFLAIGKLIMIASFGLFKALVFLFKTVSRIINWVVHSILGIFHHIFQAIAKLAVTSADFILSFQPLNPPKSWYRTISGFILASLVFALPFSGINASQILQGKKDRIIDTTQKAFYNLKDAQDKLSQKDLGSAKQDFSQAYQSFLMADKEISSFNQTIIDISANIPVVEDGLKLLELGKKMSLAGNFLSSAFENQAANQDIFKNEKNSEKPTEKLLKIQININKAVPLLNDSAILASQVDTNSLPQEYRDKFQLIKDTLPLLSQGLGSCSKLVDVLVEALGEKQAKRYIFLFQNNTEIRPTGGFIGSLAIVDIDRGEIKKITIPQGGSYDLNGALTEKLISPPAFHYINPQWQIQDANYFPDFATSAKKIMWFYEKSDGSTTDGVVAINASFASDLLAVTGPIPMPEYGKTIDKDNFLYETQTEVELNYDKKENKPKKFMSDLMPKVLEKLSQLPQEDTAKLISTLIKSVLQKDIQVYLANNDAEQNIKDLGLGGEIKSFDKDYLMLVDTNVGGGKSDLFISTQVNHLVSEEKDGSLIDTVTITKTHTANLYNSFGYIRNIDYLRLYVPQGSKLINSMGFDSAPDEKKYNPSDDSKYDQDYLAISGQTTLDPSGTMINHEFGKTVYGNWFIINPGETKTAVISYKLPFKNKTPSLFNSLTKDSLCSYSLYIQKQSGTKNLSFTHQFIGQQNINLIWSSKTDIISKINGWELPNRILNNDTVVSTIY